MVAAIVIDLYSALGPPRVDRERAFVVFRKELAQLPPYPNSVVNYENDYSGPLHFPALTLEYTLDGNCLDVHVYYEQLALAQGWAVRESATYLPTVIHSEFRKTVAGFALGLIIECFVDPSNSPGYYLAIETV